LTLRWWQQLLIQEKSNGLRFLVILTFIKAKSSILKFTRVSSLVPVPSWVKGTVSRDFQPSVFFHQSIPLWSLINGINHFWHMMENSQRNSQIQNTNVAAFVTAVKAAVKQKKAISGLAYSMAVK
jgi:hypothetical protein